MPTYDYRCLLCGHEFETRQSMKDPHLTDCPQPNCDGKIKRKIGLGSGLIFKGSGFYITDYRSDSYKAAAKADGSSSSPAPAAATPAASPAPAAASSSSSSSTSSA